MAATATSPEASPTASMGLSEDRMPEHQLPRADVGARRTTRKQRRQKHASSNGQDSSSTDSSEPEGDSWTQWEGLSGQTMQSSSSYRHLDTLGACHDYHISGFSLAQGLGPGVRLCSDYFEVAGQLWRVEVYPAGVSGEAANHLSLFLTTPGSSISANQVLHKVVIVDQSGKGHHISKTKSRVHGALLASRGIVAAYPKAVKLSHLQSHAKHYLLHDTLLIRTTVQIVRSWAYDMPPAVMYQSDYYPGLQPDMPAAASQQRHEFSQMPDMQQW
ncbi:hypothetical protein ABBQ38_012006 [Trebouxia sp. C0009 RCD-2024]